MPDNAIFFTPKLFPTKNKKKTFILWQGFYSRIYLEYPYLQKIMTNERVEMRHFGHNLLIHHAHFS